MTTSLQYCQDYSLPLSTQSILSGLINGYQYDPAETLTPETLKFPELPYNSYSKTNYLFLGTGPKDIDRLSQEYRLCCTINFLDAILQFF